jgi:hypothetical protein
MIEAGHRCAIPTCRAAVPLQIEHIEDWVKVRRHDFENMIVLCANCHGRKGNGHGQIDRRSLRQYKASLAVINSRYGDLERRVLEHFAEQRELWRPVFAEDPEVEPDWLRGLAIGLPGSMRLLMKYLVQDGYVELVPSGRTLVNGVDPTLPLITTPDVPLGAVPEIDFYRLSLAGLDFLDAWTSAQPIDELATYKD